MASQFLKLPNQRSERRHSTPVFYTNNPSTLNSVNSSNQQANNQQQNHHHHHQQQEQQRYSRSSDDSEIPLLSSSPTFLNGLFPFLDRHKHHHHHNNHHHQTNSNKSPNDKNSPTFAHRILKMKPKLTLSSNTSAQHQHCQTIECSMASGGSSSVGSTTIPTSNGGCCNKNNKKKRGGSFKRRPLKHTDS